MKLAVRVHAPILEMIHQSESSLAVRVFELPAKKVLGLIPISTALSLEKMSSSACSSTDRGDAGDQWTGLSRLHQTRAFAWMVFGL